MDSLARRWAPLSPVSSHTTVGEKPDEYWWENLPTRLYLARAVAYAPRGHERQDGGSKTPKEGFSYEASHAVVVGLGAGRLRDGRRARPDDADVQRMGVPVFRERKRLLDVLARGQLGGDRQVPDVQQRSHRPTARLRDVRSTRQGSRHESCRSHRIRAADSEWF